MRLVAAFIVVAVTVIMIGCGSDDGTSGTKRTVLRVGTDATYPPFEFANENTGQPDGFDVDLVKAVCAYHGWRPEFIVTPFDGIIPGLKNGKYDVVVSAMTITPERSAVVDFTDPYYLAGQTIAVSPDDTIIHGPEDLAGKRVGVQLGTTGEIMAREMEAVEEFSYDNIGAAFIDMSNGNLDAVLNDFPTTRAYIKRHGTAKTVGPILSTEHYGMAVRQGDSLLLRQLNEALGVLRDSSVYDSLHIEWFGAPPQEQQDDSTTRQ